LNLIELLLLLLLFLLLLSLLQVQSFNAEFKERTRENRCLDHVMVRAEPTDKAGKLEQTKDEQADFRARNPTLTIDQQLYNVAQFSGMTPVN